MIESSSRQHQQTVLIGTGLVLLFLLVYVLPLNLRPLAIPDEVRYAEIPREMLQSGNWVTPHLNALRYFEKPPLGYWLNAISIQLLGENNLAVRMPTAIAAGLTALLVYLFSLKFYAKRQTPALSAFIYLSFLGIYLIGTHSTLDSLLTLFLTAGIMSYVLATLEPRPGRAWLFWMTSGISLGLAFLTKGFLAFAVPVLVLVPWLLWQGHWRALLIKGWVVVMIAVLVALPWAVLIHWQESDFWHYFFWVEHIQRFTAEDAQHREPFYYFLMYLPLMAFPWVSLLPAAIAGLKQQPGGDPKSINRLLWLWLVIPFVFFSSSSGKLATYILPCFPPLAILIANGLTRYLAEPKKHRLFSWGAGFNLLLLCAIFAGALFLQFQQDTSSLYRSNEWQQAIILLVSLLVAIAAAVAAIRSKQNRIRLAAMLACILPFITLMTLATPAKVMERKAPEPLILEAAPMIDENSVIISAGSMFRAVNWYLKRQDVYLLSSNEVEYGLSYPDASDRLLTADAVKDMISNRHHRPVALFCNKGCPPDIFKLIPPDATKKEFGAFQFVWIQ